MYLEGKIYKDGKFWLAEIPALDAMTQGHTKAEAMDMIIDWLDTAIDNSEFHAKIFDMHKDVFTIESVKPNLVLALLLRRQRAKSGLTIRDIAKLLNLKSHNSYSQYEKGSVEPSLSQVERFVTAMNPERKVTLKVG